MKDERQSILQCLGTIPQVSAAPARRTFVRTEQGVDYYLVRYEAGVGEQVQAWLLTPAAGGRRPCVVACHQHNDEYFVGKAEPAGLYGPQETAFAVHLCRAGYTVLCPDHLGFEGRRPPEYERRANPFLEAGAYERHLFMEYLLNGSSLQAKYIADLTRAVDVLHQQPEADAARTGVVGHSLGGQEALWLAWYDRRIKAAVMSCGAALVRDLQARGINHNYAMYLPGFLTAADMDTVLGQVCPCPMLVLQGGRDPLFPRDSVDKMVAAAARAYARGQCAQRLVYRVFEDAGHEFLRPQQQVAIEFLNTWLAGA